MRFTGVFLTKQNLVNCRQWQMVINMIQLYQGRLSYNLPVLLQYYL
jgi:hypothetical protein